MFRSRNRADKHNLSQMEKETFGGEKKTGTCILFLKAYDDADDLPKGVTSHTLIF